MSDPTLNDVLSYQQPLDDQAFTQQLMRQLQAEKRRRRRIMLIFIVLGVLLTLAYLWSLLPTVVWATLLTPINGIMLFVTGAFVLWLWIDTLASD
jgi:predicted nucleic acid-binding Zn ribbon protein